MARGRFKNKMKIKKGDQVVVIAGVSKGAKGEVLEVYPAKSKVLVDEVNMISKHEKPNAKNPEGGIVKKPAPIHVSNVMLIDPSSGEPTRVSIQRDKNGVKRIAKKSGQEI